MGEPLEDTPHNFGVSLERAFRLFEKLGLDADLNAEIELRRTQLRRLALLGHLSSAAPLTVPLCSASISPCTH